MNCPHGHTTLLMSERQGVEVDYCPECRGVWLDRGELDKIIERAVAEVVDARGGVRDARPEPSRAPQPDRDRDRYRDDRDRDRYRDDRDRYRDDRDRDRHDPYYKKRKKKTSFLEDLFEF